MAGRTGSWLILRIIRSFSSYVGDETRLGAFCHSMDEDSNYYRALADTARALKQTAVPRELPRLLGRLADYYDDVADALDKSPSRSTSDSVNRHE